MSKLKALLYKATNNPSFTLKEQMGYASGIFGNSMGQDTVGTYYEQFLYDFMGLNNKTIIPLNFVTALSGFVTDPIAGWLLDIPRKSGVKHFLLFSSIPLALASVLLFVVPGDSYLLRVLYVYAAYLIYNITDSFYDMSLLTLSARMSSNPKDRKNFYTVAQFASTLGSMLPGWILPIIVDAMGNDYSRQRLAYLLVALLFGAMGLAAMLVPSFTLREKVFLKVNQKQSVKVNLRAILHNRPLLLLTLSQTIDSIRQVCYKTLPFFYKQTMGQYSMKAAVDAASGVLSYVGILLVPVLGNRISARTILAGGYMFTGICYMILGTLGYNSKLIVGILIAIAGFPNGGMSVARKVQLADSTDYMEWRTHEKYGEAVRSDGMVFAFNSMANRIAKLWKSVLFNFGLELIGYQSAKVVNGESIEAVQTPKTLKGIFYLVVIPGIIGNIIPGIVMLLDNFTGKKKDMIYEQLRKMHEAQASENQTEYIK